MRNEGTRYLVGIGNYTQTDDSVGLRIAQAAVERALDRAHGFEVLEIGDNGLSLLSYFRPGVSRMLWVDCVRAGQRPGEWVLFSPDEVVSGKRLRLRSTHEGDLLQVIELARQAGYPLPEIRILGIEPESVKWGLELSQTLERRFEEYLERAIRELAAEPASVRV